MIDLVSQLTHRKKGYTLEAPFYTDADIFAADMEVIFGRHWLFVGVEPDVPEPGDVMVVDIGKTSVAVVRDDDGEVRAFHNVCRHRGARLVHEEKSTVGNLVCRYHSWVYDTTGQLIHAEHMGEDFDRVLPRPEAGAHPLARRPALHLPRRKPAAGFRRAGARHVAVSRAP